MHDHKKISRKYTDHLNTAYWHSRSNVNDKCFTAYSRASAIHPSQGNTHTILPAFLEHCVSSCKNWTVLLQRLWDKQATPSIKSETVHVVGTVSCGQPLIHLLQGNSRLWILTNFNSHGNVKSTVEHNRFYDVNILFLQLFQPLNGHH
jgi:hypothetical protein